MLTRTKAAAAVNVDTVDLEQPQLQPYVRTVVEHLKRTDANSGSSSSSTGSSGSSRGRGAKRAAARGLLECHSAVFQAALDLELQEEWREAEERLQVCYMTCHSMYCSNNDSVILGVTHPQ